ncbi:MAG: hypothetical protein ACPLX8_01435 [Nanopusillaceae archaeon]
MDEKKLQKIYINLLFLAFVLPTVYLIYYAYSSYYKSAKTINPGNPFGLYISDLLVDNSTITFFINNPSNYTLPLYFTLMALKNSYETSSIIAPSSSLSQIYYLSPNGSIKIIYNYANDESTKLVLYQWRSLGGSLYISLYYEARLGNKTIDGIINEVFKK